MKLRFFLISLVMLPLAFVSFTYYVSRPAFDEQRGMFQPRIADKNEALTFARTKTALILVASQEGDTLKGINLSEALEIPTSTNLLDWLPTVDQDVLRSLVAPIVTMTLDDLIRPVDYHFPHIAAGTNFKEHAEEVYVDDPPFLFPKLTESGNWQDAVPFVPRLDFEAELCVFPLEDINAADVEAGGTLPGFGLVLCNDFTDRWTLVSELDLSEPLGLTGFAAGKGCTGCLPTGYLVVIPRSPDFYLSLNISLYVNNRLRQKFSMQDVILTVEDIVRQSFEKTDASYLNGEESVSIMPEGKIPQGTLILTGTAGGVIFKPANIWHQGFYLQQGDLVRTEGAFLGHLMNKVTNN